MVSEEKIVNKIIPIQTIIDVANYFEDKKDEYKSLFEKDRQKNENLKYSEQVYEYKGTDCKVQYTVKFKDGKELTEANYNWFIGMIDKIVFIQKISIYYSISYFSNYKNNQNYEYMNLYTFVNFGEDSVSISVNGKNLEEEVYKVHSYLRGLIENNDYRYNKTVKHRNFRIQSFCLTIGFVLSYILYLIMLVNKKKLTGELEVLINNKFVLIIGQWFVAFLIGNILGFPIMKTLYKTIVPKTKYSHYNRSSSKSVYVDDIEKFISSDEVQIGINAYNGKKRLIIERIYKITSKIVLLQLILSIIFFIVFK